jgi:hypothetical protein
MSAELSAPSARSALPRRGVATMAALGVGLLLAGIFSLGLWRVLSGSENLPFADGAANPPAAHVTEGDTYSLAVPGGVRALIAHGVYGDPQGALTLECQWSVGHVPPQVLDVNAERTDTKAETTVGRFTAPVTGSIRVTCSNWGAVFVPDADGAASDTAGWLLVASTVLLTAGVACALSAARTASLQRSRWPGEDDEVEGFVDGAVGGRSDDEVGRRHGEDVVP